MGWDGAARAGLELQHLPTATGAESSHSVGRGTDCRAGNEHWSSGTQQWQLQPREHWSCLSGAAEIPALEPWDLTAPGSARKREEAAQCWERDPQSQPGTSSGHSPPATVRVTGTEPWCCSDRAAAAATAQTQPQLLLPDPAQALQGRAQSGLLRAGVPLTPPRPRLWHRSHSTISSCLSKPSLPGTPCTLVPQSPPGLQAESEPGESESKKTEQGTDLSTA